MYRIALVCEGPTDRAILEAVLDRYFEDYVPLAIQPPKAAIGGDAGPFGGGWKGVRSWCAAVVAQGGLDRVAVLENADILVIQVDADVAHDPEIGRAKPCPPPEDTVDEIRALILQWLGRPTLPDKVILCVPSMASETWAFVALFPQHPAVVPCDPPPNDGECIECRRDIKRLLQKAGKDLRPKLVQSQAGALKNQVQGYEALQPRITKGWSKVLAMCSEARRFDDEIRRRSPSDEGMRT